MIPLSRVGGPWRQQLRDRSEEQGPWGPGTLGLDTFVSQAREQAPEHLKPEGAGNRGGQVLPRPRAAALEVWLGQGLKLAGWEFCKAPSSSPTPTSGVLDLNGAGKSGPISAMGFFPGGKQDSLGRQVRTVWKGYWAKEGYRSCFWLLEALWH